MPALRPYRWKGPELDALRSAYEAGAVNVDDLAASLGTSRGQVMRLARRDGWKRRGAGPLPAAAHLHWNKYRDTQRFGGRALALEVVAGLVGHDADVVVAGAIPLPERAGAFPGGAA